MKQTPLPAHDWPDEADATGDRECRECGSVWRAEYRTPPPWSCRRNSRLDRSKGLAAVSDRKDDKRPDLGTPLQGYVEGLPCLLADRPDHRCEGEVVAHHVAHKNHAGDWIERGGERRGNLVPLCSLAGHQGGPESVHVLGRDTFEERWEVDLSEAARRTGEAYREQGT